MQQYHPDLQAIDLQTRQLEHQRCPHCQRAQFVSHRYVYQKPASCAKRTQFTSPSCYAHCG
jgi:hypothetical protein